LTCKTAFLILSPQKVNPYQTGGTLAGINLLGGLNGAVPLFMLRSACPPDLG
jgi:hypothetical protein